MNITYPSPRNIQKILFSVFLVWEIMTISLCASATPQHNIETQAEAICLQSRARLRLLIK